MKIQIALKKWPKMKKWVKNSDYSNWIEINLNKIASVLGQVEKLGLKISI